MVKVNDRRSQRRCGFGLVAVSPRPGGRGWGVTPISHADFPSHKNFQKALHDKTRKIETLVLSGVRTFFAFGGHCNNTRDTKEHILLHALRTTLLKSWNYPAAMCRNYHKSSDCYEYPKNPYLNQAAQKDTCQNFATTKNPEIENFKLKKILKILRSSLSLEIRSNIPPPPPGG